MNSLVNIPSWQVDSELAILINNYNKPGYLLYYEETRPLKTNPIDLLQTKLEALGAAVTTTAPTTAGGEIVNAIHKKFALHITVRSKPNITLLIKGVADPVFQPIIHDIKKEIESELAIWNYGIHVREYYWSVREQRIEQTVVWYGENDFADVIPTMYPGINIPRMIELFLESKETILICVGEPGTGKTCLSRRIVYDMCNKKKTDLYVAYTKDKTALKSDEFWSELRASQCDLLILDDLDKELAPRSDSADNDSIVSKILSFSNGTFPVKTKILVTSNMPGEKIDAAVLRPGRCFDMLKLQPMPAEMARNIWENVFKLAPAMFDSQFNSSIITQAEFMSIVLSTKNGLRRDYLTNEHTSVRTQYADTKAKGVMHIKAQKS